MILDDPARRRLACIGDASRFRLVVALAQGGRCVTELAAAIGLSQSCTTRHLQTLDAAGLTRRSRDGKRVIVSLRRDEPALRPLFDYVLAMGASSTETAVGATAMVRRPRRTALRAGGSAGLSGRTTASTPRKRAPSRTPRNGATDPAVRPDVGSPASIDADRERPVQANPPADTVTDPPMDVPDEAPADEAGDPRRQPLEDFLL